ncbi:MAG: hypothetical protein JST28_05070 [Acidobacteria bacterium]|nr:hypothetical protein [Acidobacteriota bacterium]
MTNAILIAHVGRESDDEIPSLNEFLRTHQIGGGEFKEVSDHAGGYRHLECRVYLSAFNHADTNAIVDAVRRSYWRDKQTLQLFIKEQEDELFTQRYCGADESVALRVPLKPEELRIICNALNEVCHGIDLRGEFETRMGASLDESRQLLDDLLEILKRPAPEDPI